jgi:hypothetical protein
MNDPDTFMATYKSHREARAKLSDGNKAAIFDALAAAGITSVNVEFNGEGDSGQIEAIVAFCANEATEFGNESTELPTTPVNIQQLSWGSTHPVTTAVLLSEAIETLCYNYLEETCGGWENNEGAFGDFTSPLTAARLNWNSTTASPTSTPRTIHSEGGKHGTSISPFTVESLSSVKKWSPSPSSITSASMTGSTPIGS